MDDNMLGGPVPHPAQNWSLAKDIVCEDCGNSAFVEGVMFKKLSKLAAGTDKDLVRPIPVFVCSKCGAVAKEFVPNMK
jgi:uncharacterized Zn finger protein